MVAKAKQKHCISTDEVRVVSVDFSDQLDGAESIITVDELQSSVNLTLSNGQINSSKLKINGRWSAIGKAVLFDIQSSVEGEYTIEVLASTDSGQTIEGQLYITVEATIY